MFHREATETTFTVSIKCVTTQMLLHSTKVTILMIMMYTIIVTLALLGSSLVMAQDDTCTRYGFDIDLPGASCADIYNKNPTSHTRSGYYVLKTDHLFFAYCDMELDCGGNKGGWMRIANINKGNTCPSGWTRYSSYCTGGSAAGCYSAIFSTNSTSCTKVCGKVVGYQRGTMDGFYPSAYAHGKAKDYIPKSSSRSLDGVYVDGISITSGNPRKHVWTYAVGLSDDYNYPLNNCPCAKYPGPDPPAYISNHYYCESGNTGTYTNEHTRLYSDDSLWDGAGCLSENSCCYDAGMPWFFRQFPTPTTGDLEVRICHDSNFGDQNVVVEQLQLYIQ